MKRKIAQSSPQSSHKHIRFDASTTTAHTSQMREIPSEIVQSILSFYELSLHSYWRLFYKQYKPNVTPQQWLIKYLYGNRWDRTTIFLFPNVTLVPLEQLGVLCNVTLDSLQLVNCVLRMSAIVSIDFGSIDVSELDFSSPGINYRIERLICMERIPKRKKTVFSYVTKCSNLKTLLFLNYQVDDYSLLFPNLKHLYLDYRYDDTLQIVPPSITKLDISGDQNLSIDDILENIKECTVSFYDLKMRVFDMKNLTSLSLKAETLNFKLNYQNLYKLTCVRHFCIDDITPTEDICKWLLQSHNITHCSILTVRMDSYTQLSKLFYDSTFIRRLLSLNTTLFDAKDFDTIVLNGQNLTELKLSMHHDLKIHQLPQTLKYLHLFSLGSLRFDDNIIVPASVESIGLHAAKFSFEDVLHLKQYITNISNLELKCSKGLPANAVEVLLKMTSLSHLDIWCAELPDPSWIEQSTTLNTLLLWINMKKRDDLDAYYTAARHIDMFGITFNYKLK
jgi:hypothetical protein